MRLVPCTRFASAIGRAALVVAALLLTACEGRPSLTAPEVQLARTGADGAASTSIVGTWRRVVYVPGDASARSTEIAWRFDPDGAVLRTEVTRDALGGAGRVGAVIGRWRVVGDVLWIDLAPPSLEPIRIPFRVQGDLLILDGEIFTRVRP